MCILQRRHRLRLVADDMHSAGRRCTQALRAQAAVSRLLRGAVTMGRLWCWRRNHQADAITTVLIASAAFLAAGIGGGARS